jgi:soluble lytic murein transglycosylase-like protein
MIPAWAMQLPINLIYAKGRQFGVDPLVIMALVWQESRGSVYAVRYEPKYKWLWKPEKFHGSLGIDLKTEINMQKQSYGLLQVMGGTARWLNFEGHLGALYKPENNLYWGVKYLAKLKEKYGDTESYLSAYNQGSPRKDDDGNFLNQKYVDDVCLLLAELKKENQD